MYVYETTNEEFFVLKIIFPDLSDANIKPIDKSQVTITGVIDGVYMAKQQLIVSNIFHFEIEKLLRTIKMVDDKLL